MSSLAQLLHDTDSDSEMEVERLSPPTPLLNNNANANANANDDNKDESDTDTDETMAIIKPRRATKRRIISKKKAQKSSDDTVDADISGDEDCVMNERDSKPLKNRRRRGRPKQVSDKREESVSVATTPPMAKKGRRRVQLEPMNTPAPRLRKGKNVEFISKGETIYGRIADMTYDNRGRLDKILVKWQLRSGDGRNKKREEMKWIKANSRNVSFPSRREKILAQS